MIYDISAPLTPDLVTWPGVVERFERTLVASFAAGDQMEVSAFKTGAHAGTHIDAPKHFIPGAGGIETIPIRSLVGPAYVVKVADHVSVIGREELETAGIPEGTTRLLLKTANSGWTAAKEFDTDYVACDVTAAQWLVERNINLVGIDYLSVEPFTADADGFPTHQLLLHNGIVVLESLELADVPPGHYQLIALPLLVPGSDGAPTRAVLVETPT